MHSCCRNPDRCLESYSSGEVLLSGDEAGSALFFFDDLLDFELGESPAVASPLSPSLPDFEVDVFSDFLPCCVLEALLLPELSSVVDVEIAGSVEMERGLADAADFEVEPAEDFGVDRDAGLLTGVPIGATDAVVEAPPAVDAGDCAAVALVLAELAGVIVAAGVVVAVVLDAEVVVPEVVAPEVVEVLVPVLPEMFISIPNRGAGTP